MVRYKDLTRLFRDCLKDFFLLLSRQLNVFVREIIIRQVQMLISVIITGFHNVYISRRPHIDTHYLTQRVKPLARTEF